MVHASMNLKILGSNSVTMIAEKLIHTAVNFLVVAVLARQLGPENFGLLSLVQAVFFVGLHLAIFCSEQVMVKFTLNDSSSTESLYRRARILKYATAIPVYIASVLLAAFYMGHEFAVLVAVYCTIHLTNVDLLFFSLFRARQDGKTVLLARSSVVIPFAAIKVLVALTSGDLLYIAAAYALESLVLGVLALTLFRRGLSSVQDNVQATAEHANSSKESQPDTNKAAYKRLVDAAWPILTSAFLITLYARVDQFMIQSMLGEAQVGIYSTAVKLSEASTYVMSTLIASRFPILLQLHKGERSLYRLELSRLFTLTLLFSLALIVFIYFASELILQVVFGPSYSAAATTLFIHISGTLFIYFGVICTQYLIAEGLQIFRLYRVLFGLLINIILNLILIPHYGITGAALATLISQALSCVFFNAFSQKTREIYLLQIGSLAFWRWKTLL